MRQHTNQHQNGLDLYRQRMRLTLTQVARLLGHADGSALSAYERGQRLPSLVNALRLSIILRVPVEFLFPALYDSLRRDIRGTEEQARVAAIKEDKHDHT